MYDDTLVPSLFGEMDQFINSISRNIVESRAKESSSFFVPSMEVAETGNKFIISTDLPGMKENDIDVSFSDGVLTISGEKKQEKEGKKTSYYQKEISYGNFHREIALPVDIDSEKVNASYDRGVLTVILQKDLQSKACVKKIPITSS